jgi:hypothetical protein
MPKVRIEKSLDGKSPDDCFNLSSAAFLNAGFSIFKTREIAWLVIAHRKENNSLIEASIGARPPGNCAQVVVSVSSSDLQKEVLQAHADNILMELEKLL